MRVEIGTSAAVFHPVMDAALAWTAAPNGRLSSGLSGELFFLNRRTVATIEFPP